MDALSQWCRPALNVLASAMRNDNFWAAKATSLGGRSSTSSIHLAVLVEPFLTYVLDGTKTIESRFSLRRCAPYEKVREGDLVFLKAASGPVVGICLVGQTWHYELDDTRRADIQARFAKPMRAEATAFWKSRKGASFATLMEIREARTLPSPMRCPKRDRRGWVILMPRAPDMEKRAG